MVSIRKPCKYRISWKDVDKNIYDEDSEKGFEVRVFGIRVFKITSPIDTKHDLSDKYGKSVGFDVSKGSKSGR